MLSCNGAGAIIMNIILSTQYLGEKFIWRYDMTAMIFIAIGYFLVVFQVKEVEAE